jgi:hypothetical protein
MRCGKWVDACDAPILWERSLFRRSDRLSLSKEVVAGEPGPVHVSGAYPVHPPGVRQARRLACLAPDRPGARQAGESDRLGSPGEILL